MEMDFRYMSNGGILVIHNSIELRRLFLKRQTHTRHSLVQSKIQVKRTRNTLFTAKESLSLSGGFTP